MTHQENQELKKALAEFDYHDREFGKALFPFLYGEFGLLTTGLAAKDIIIETVREVGNKGFQYLLQDPKFAALCFLGVSSTLSLYYALKKAWKHEPKRDELIWAAIRRKDLEEYNSEK